MTDLAGLIERLEGSSGPDREIDRALMRVTHKRVRRWIGATCNCCPDGNHKDLVWACRKAGKWVTTAKFGFEVTGSFDRALAFKERVLPGWAWAAGDDGGEPEGRQAWARVFPWPKLQHRGSGNWNGATPAIALLIATLRALQASTGDERWPPSEKAPSNA